MILAITIAHPLAHARTHTHCLSLSLSRSPPPPAHPSWPLLSRSQDWPFNDGDPPPDGIITAWLTLVKTCFGDKKPDVKNKKCASPASYTLNPKP